MLSRPSREKREKKERKEIGYRQGSHWMLLDSQAFCRCLAFAYYLVGFMEKTKGYLHALPPPPLSLASALAFRVSREFPVPYPLLAPTTQAKIILKIINNFQYSSAFH